MNLKILFFSTIACMVAFTGMTWAQEVVWKKNFGGSGVDEFSAVTAVSDGLVAVGHSYAFGNGDWTGVTGKGMWDAIIVKYDHEGNVIWKKSFGGNGRDEYYAVTAVTDGIIAVGYSDLTSFGNGDWEDVVLDKGFEKAIIVKYDNAGNIVWKKYFDEGQSSFQSIVAVPDGFVAAGGGGMGGAAIIFKCDNEGNVLWNNDYRHGSEDHAFLSVAAASDDIIAVGCTYNDVNFGRFDAVIVKYDSTGNVIWDQYFGGNGTDRYESVTLVSDGIIAVGQSRNDSFGNGDWVNVTGKGSTDAIIVKYDTAGNVVWKKNFGGSGNDTYHAVTVVSDNIIAVGSFGNDSFGNGDWTGVLAKDGSNNMIVIYDIEGNIVSKKNFNTGLFNDVTVVSDGIVVVGHSWRSNFDSGDWTGVTGKGETDAIMIKYGTLPITSNAEILQGKGLRIYPNPATAQLVIENGDLQIHTIEIFDAMGRLQQSETGQSETGVTIDISQLQQGIYILHVDGKTAKIVKR